jgi:two-component system, NtrC family, nitrogen regulation sensor histidine kinase NtrY
MRGLRNATSTTAGLISIVFLYVLLIALILFFSNQMLLEVSRGSSFSNITILPLAIVLPLFLFGSIIFNAVRLLRERAARKPGVRFKIRLILFFTFIVILSSIPQGILSIGFIDTTLNSWFSRRLGDALRGGLEVALEYYNDKLENLRAFDENSLARLYVEDLETAPDRAWRRIREINPDLDSMQIVDAGGSELFFMGDGIARMDPLAVARRGEGTLSKESRGEATVLRLVKEVLLSGEQRYIVFSMVLPSGFDDKAQELTKALETFRQLERYRTVFRLVLIAFFSLFSLPMILLSILVSFLLSEEIIRPIVNLEDATRRVAEGDYSFRILARSKDELYILIRSFNKMVSELERSRKEILQTEKVTAWQEIAQRMAHEIKNPLTPIRLSAERILRKYKNQQEDLGTALENGISAIIREVDNLTRLLAEFRDFAKVQPLELERVRLRELVEETVSVYDASYPGTSMETEEVPEEILIKVDRKQLGRVLGNLFKNAIEAMDGKGTLFVRADLVMKGDLKYARIQIQDTGSGIEADHYGQVFNPYFTTKKKGTGLGLSIVERIIFDHGGEIWFESESGTGTTFFIDLPAE